MAAMKDGSPAHDLHARCWARVAARDASADGEFVYAVSSTGVYCRPSCPSRRPARERVCFFRLPALAEAAGFRACKRCRPNRGPAVDPRLAAVGRALRLIAEKDDGIPTLGALSRVAALSPHHLQRLFKNIVGLSPRKYGEALRLARLKRGLKEGNGVLDALYGAGFGSASRLYEHAPAGLGMTPAAYARGGQGATISFTVAVLPLGRLLVAATTKGVAMVALGDDDKALERDLRREFPAAAIRRDDGGLAKTVSTVLARLDGCGPSKELPLDVKATAFQAQVWQALKAIPAGETRSYGEIAEKIGRPGAARAVARACATNPVALVIPCHRAVAGSGSLAGYRWGVERKAKILERERRALRKRRA
jgi:AraC family transcriptional regulator of adaptative response/methylated-DNA-[protein]-cysteine methyltransferase